MKPPLVRWSALALALLLTSLVLAQDPPARPGGKKPVVEEEEDTPKNKKPPTGKGEEEEAPKNKKPVPRDDEEESPTKPKRPVPREDGEPSTPKRSPMGGDATPMPKKPGAGSAASDKADFAAEAARATHPDVKRLYQSVAVIADYVQTRKTTEPLMVDIIGEYVGPRSNTLPIRYQPYGPDGKLGVAAYTAPPGEIVKIISFEEKAIEAVSNFIIDMQKYPAGHARYQPPTEVLATADRVLTAAFKFHETSRTSDKRKGNGWDVVRGHLRTKYLEVLADLLKAEIASTDPKAADRAADVAFRIDELFPDNLQARREVEMWKLSIVPKDLSMHDGEYIKAAQTLQELQIKFASADPKVLEPLRDALRRRAQAHFDEAKRLAATEDGKPAALRQSDMAMKIWPQLPGLRDYQMALARDFRLLVIGVKRLPEMMSPALAISDADRWACELLFEGLIKTVPDASVGQRYVPGLALRLPRTLSMGREFELPRDAVWVDRTGQADRLDSSDVRSTLAMLQEHNRLPIAEDIDLLSEPSIQDAFRFPLRLERGTPDPLSAMSFKVLPAKRLASKSDGLLDREFAMNPVGSGPFVYHGRKTEDGREYAVFKANPHYSKRTGRFGRPRIQEIRFVVPPGDVAADLREGRIDAVLDVSTADMMRLRSPQAELAKVATDYTLATRRIWMLAVNHRQPNLGLEIGRSLRRAIAYSINREEIIKTFRAGTTNHAVLNGPFPPGTWAAPETKGNLYRPEYASSEIKSAKTTTVSIKYADDPLAKIALEQIKKQAAVAGIELTLVPMPLPEFHKAVYLEHDYELAYVPFDFASEMYSLRGVFDEEATGRGERNFLGYKPDANISQLLLRINSTRDFSKIREAMHLLYSRFEDQMPFIPLWQLNFHVLLSQKMETMPAPAELDPLTIFDVAEEWRINR